MTLLSNIEKGALIKLFNRGGYVLDFSTADFDAFTMDSIGEALCSKYKLSKGRSLISYIDEAPESNSIKLLIDLFDYYEANGLDTQDIGTLYETTYQRCKFIIERVKSQLNNTTLPINNLKIAFSNEYISSQLDLMLKMQEENPTESIGKSKELIESCCETILERNGVEINKDWKLNNLVDETMKLLKVTPDHIPETAKEAKAIKAILGSLKGIASNIAIIRNAYGSGHGKSSSYKGLQERHAKLAIGSSITLVQFLWDSYERQKKS